MPPLAVMFKTVSTDCNLDCSYCYYRESLEGARVRRRIDDGMLEKLIPQVMEYVQDVRLARLMWQGGEPTLAGLPFFQKVMDLELEHARPGTYIENSIQTNGVLLNDDWGAFLRRYRWLVGVSLDGPREVHDRLRRDRGDHGTFDHVMRGIGVLQRHGVDFNVLCVLGPHNIDRPRELMSFYRAQGFTHVQFIPAMDFQAFEPWKPATYLIDPACYGEFLVEAFERWYQDGGPTLSVRIFDNFLQSYAGIPNDLCVHSDRCDTGLVVEWDGSAYPCDFYVHPSFRLGSVIDTPLTQLMSHPQRAAFVAQKAPLPAECARCEWLAVCKSGCPRNRTSSEDGARPDHFCASYKRFFAHADARLRSMADAIDARRRYIAVQQIAPREILRAARNDPCPCGSGRKHKRCCGDPALASSYVFKS